MGASIYWYQIPYEPDFNSALEKLRVQEFNAGRYNPVIPFPKFPITDQSENPGPQHSSIDAPLNESEGEGTRSILDIVSVSDEDDYCVARLLKNSELVKYFGTEKPTKEQVEKNNDFYNDIGRGKAFCIILYKNNLPDELFFVGYSFD